MSNLFEVQRRLQAEADEVVRALRLDEILSRVGQPVRVGSSAMGLMVRRDIDITVICPKIDTQIFDEFTAIGARLMRASDLVVEVRFRNDSGTWNRESDKYPDGLYLWLSVQTPEQKSWTVDIWLIDQPERQPDISHLQTLMPRLTEAHREAILRIKVPLAEHPRNADTVSSAAVYEAVLDHGIRTLAEFEAWQRARQE